MSEIPDEHCVPPTEDSERLVQYLGAALFDSVRISVLLAHCLIEDMIDDFIKELVPNHEFLTLPKARFPDKLRWARALDYAGSEEPFWKFIETFTELRNAAAHRNWSEKRSACFVKLRQITSLKSGGYPIRTPDDDQEFVRSIMVHSFGYLWVARRHYQRLKAGIAKPS